jgi:hypothetical protein
MDKHAAQELINLLLLSVCMNVQLRNGKLGDKTLVDDSKEEVVLGSADEQVKGTGMGEQSAETELGG